MSRRPLRLAALAGAAAVALGIATPTVAAAVEHTATVHSVATTATPITHAGRVINVTMPTTHYVASVDHSDAVVNLAVAGPSAVPATNVAPAYDNVTPANVTPASAAGTISVSAAALFLFGGLLIFGIRRNEIKKGWAFIAVGFGVFSGATIVGVIYSQVLGSGISLINNF